MTGLRLKIGKLFSKQCLRDWRKFNEKKRWLGKKELLYNWLRGKKLLTFSKINLLFFFWRRRRKEKWSMQVWFPGILYSILALLLSRYIKSCPLLLRFVPFIRLFSYSIHTRCPLVDSQRISNFLVKYSSPFNPLLIPFTRFILTHLVLLSLLEENFKFHHQTLPTKNPNHCSISYIFNKFNFYQRTKKHHQNC